MSAHTFQDFAVGDRVHIDDLPSTRGYHFLPSMPGNTGTVCSLDEEKNTIFVDLDPLHDDDDRIQRTAEQIEKISDMCKNWAYSPKELLIEELVPGKKKKEVSTIC